MNLLLVEGDVGRQAALEVVVLLVDSILVVRVRVQLVMVVGCRRIRVHRSDALPLLRGR